MNAEKNKLEIGLITMGTGVLAFAIWTCVKLILSDLFLGMNFDNEMSQNMKIVAVVIAYMFIAVDVPLNCYAGLSARAEGKGKKKTPLYLVVTVLILICRSLIILLEIYLLFASETGKLTIAVSVIIDVTAAVIMTEMAVNAIRLRRLRRLAEKEAADEL